MARGVKVFTTEDKIKIRRNLIDICSKQGFLIAVNELYFEYESKPFLYNTKTPDFLALYKKFSEEKIKTLESYNADLFRKSIQKANLKLKVDEDIAFSVFSLLFSTIASKGDLSSSCDYHVAFQFILNKVVDDIFE